MREAYKIIHYALHSDVAVVTVDGIDYPILKVGNGCRYVTFEGVKIMQQNIHKNSNFAARARAGEKITWVMVQPTWICIDDATLRPLPLVGDITSKTMDSVPKQRFQPTDSAGSAKRRSDTGNHRDTRGFWRSPK